MLASPWEVLAQASSDSGSRIELPTAAADSYFAQLGELPEVGQVGLKLMADPNTDAIETMADVLAGNPADDELVSYDK